MVGEGGEKRNKTEETMPRKKSERTPEEDREAFIRAARELGCDESEEALKATIKKLAEQKPGQPVKSKKKPRNS